MDLKELTALGISEDLAKEIVEKNAAEVAVLTQKVSEAEAKVTASADTVKELTEKVKAFDGVDVKKLQEDVVAAQTKYDTDLAAVKTDSAIDLALVKAGAKDNNLVKTLIDKTLLKVDDKGNLVGFTEQLENIKKDKDYLFAAAKEPDTNDTGMTADSARAHGGVDTEAGLTAFETAAKEAAGIPTETQNKK